MSIQVASIIFNDSSSRFNKDLTDYLQRNLEQAIKRGGLSFKYKIAQPSDLPDLRQKGVKRLPAMLIGNAPFVGVPSIIQEIQKRIRTSRVVVQAKTPEEEVRDFHTQLLTAGVTKNAEGKFEVKEKNDDDESENLSAQLQSKFNSEIQKRGSSIGHGGDKQSASQNQPSRRATQDNDETDYNMRPARAHPRSNNVASNDPMADAYKSLQNISRGASGEDAQDDALMGTLLDRMGME